MASSINISERDLFGLKTWLEAATEQLARPVRRLAIRVVNDAEMAVLHLRHSGIDETTDVLTFDSSLPTSPIDADIAVCFDEARRRAAELGHSTNHELLLYAVHGLLHCCGHDDHDEDTARVMHAEEDRILSAIGVGAIYSPRGESRP